MIEFVIILFIILLVLLYFYHEIYKANRGLLNLKKCKEDFQKAVEEFEFFISGAEYFNNRKNENWREEFNYLADKINFDPSKAIIEKEFKEIIHKFINYRKIERKIIDEYNENFVESESERILPILEEKGIKSDHDQRKSIVCEEDHTLIVAGAGTGKTQTILGKVAYLCLDKKVQPDEILLLSFTKKATQELRDRIHKISSKLHINTFNSIGFQIIGKVSGNKPSVAFENESTYKNFIDGLFNSRLKSDNAFLSLAIDYFLYYLYPIELNPGYETKDEYYKSLKAGNILTIKKEPVKSIQEAMIANFLFTHKINYEYERKYQYKTSNSDYSQYKPDFYLSAYGIYLEHFGIDRKGNTHFTKNEEQNKIDSIKYNMDMKVKRNIHLKYKTKLIETFSYEFFEGDWKEKLIEKLKESGVKLERRSEDEILEEIKKGDYIRLIVPLICTFLNLMKSCNYSIEEIKDKFEKKRYERGIAFMKMFEAIYESYNQHLKDNDEIDFNDMLLQAADYVHENKYTHNYKHIIVDEFQDFSFSKYKLTRAMLDQKPNTRLFCVGDDWQSIYRFTGSDVSLMFNFEERFGFSKRLLLEKCHRFNNELAEITNEFILINEHQLKKKLYSDIHSGIYPLQIKYKESDKDVESLRNILEYINGIAQKNNDGTRSVFLLGRYNFNEPEGIDYSDFRFVKVKFITVHSAKGLTCDYAIILNNETGKYGFPSEYADDPIINAVLSGIDPSPHSEERRLMYVALTRAKNQVFLLAQQKNKSVFIRELEKNNQSENIKICRECGGEMKERTGPYSTFFGCSNFPYCKYKEKIAII